MQRNLKNTQNLDDKITKKTGGRKMAQTEQKNQNVKNSLRSCSLFGAGDGASDVDGFV